MSSIHVNDNFGQWQSPITIAMTSDPPTFGNAEIADRLAGLAHLR
jgi:hypothetical protein